MSNCHADWRLWVSTTQHQLDTSPYISVRATTTSVHWTISEDAQWLWLSFHVQRNSDCAQSIQKASIAHWSSWQWASAIEMLKGNPIGRGRGHCLRAIIARTSALRELLCDTPSVGDTRCHIMHRMHTPFKLMSDH